MDFDSFDGMKVDELKNYLKLRGLKVSGKKTIIVARAFAANENKTPVVMNAEEVEAELKVEYDLTPIKYISLEIFNLKFNCNIHSNVL